MKIYHGYRNITDLKDPILAIGIFDGIHIGHKRVLSRLFTDTDKSRSKVVMTFDPHPKAVIQPSKNLPRIMSLEHRINIFKKMGIDAVVVIKFTEYISKMSPEDFIRKVISHMGVRKVYVGSNFQFGRKKAGDIDIFNRIASQYGVEVKKVNPVKKRGRIVSSTWLRKLILNGKLKTAEEILRRPVSILGTVVRGDSRGRELGVPTANIDPHHEVSPPSGVYAVKIDVEGKLYDGVLNIGFRPTFYGKRLKKRKEPSIEVNIFDFSGHLYGLSVEIFFIEKMRKEKKFRKEYDLVQQIQKDKERAKEALKDPRIIRKIKNYKHL